MITRTDRIATRLRFVAPLAALAAVACAAPSTSRQSPTPAVQPTPAQVAERQRADDRMRNDWASLHRYGQANDSLRPPTPGERRVVFSISGQTAPQMLVRFRQDVIALKPAVVVILAGTNDIAGNTGPSTLEMIEDNLMSMTELAKANGIRVVLSSVLPVYDYPWRPGLEPARKIVALNAWMKTYAERVDAVYLDYHSAMVDDRLGLRSDLTRDGVIQPRRAIVLWRRLRRRRSPKHSVAREFARDV